MHNILLNDLIFALILILMKMAVIFYFSCRAWIQSQHKLHIIWIQSQRSQAFEKMPIWVLWSTHAPRFKLASLTLCICMCVFSKLTKCCFSLMLCSQRRHLAPAWSHKCKHTRFQVFNGFMSHWAKEWEGFLGDKTQIGCYCPVLPVLVFGQLFHMPHLLFGG